MIANLIAVFLVLLCSGQISAQKAILGITCNEVVKKNGILINQNRFTSNIIIQPGSVENLSFESRLSPARSPQSPVNIALSISPESFYIGDIFNYITINLNLKSSDSVDGTELHSSKHMIKLHDAHPKYKQNTAALTIFNSSFPEEDAKTNNDGQFEWFQSDKSNPHIMCNFYLISVDQTGTEINKKNKLSFEAYMSKEWEFEYNPQCSPKTCLLGRHESCDVFDQITLIDFATDILDSSSRVMFVKYDNLIDIIKLTPEFSRRLDWCTYDILGKENCLSFRESRKYLFVRDIK